VAGSGDNESELGATVPASVSDLPASPARAPAIGPGSEIGRYRLVTRLGAGAMGEVWKATDPQLERDIAIKLVHPRLARTPEVSARMVREARAMAKVSHRAVIAIHDSGEVDGRLFLAMELVNGRTLGSVFRDRGRDDLRDWRRWISIMIDAGRGLAAAHAAGVLHRDFKPDNVLVDDHGRVCVGDFGVATLGGTRSTESLPMPGDVQPNLTTTGALLGTPAYMSLEQLRGDAVDARSDQFSFCVATYEALYGERPFKATAEEARNLYALAESIEAHRLRDPPDGSLVPAEVRAIIVRGLAPEPHDRWPSLDALLAALDRAVAPKLPLWRSPRVLVPVTVVALAGVGLALWRRGSSEHGVIARPVGPTPLHAALALSPGGRLVSATNTLEVHDLVTDQRWTLADPHTRGAATALIEFEDEHTVRWMPREGGGPWEWDLATNVVKEAPLETEGTWIGTVVGGSLVERESNPNEWELALVDHGKTVSAWPHAGGRLDSFDVSPNRRRFVYASSERFIGHIVALDVTTGAIWRSDGIAGISAIAWRDNDTVLYATMTEASTLYEMRLGSEGFGPPRIVYRPAVGSVGKVLVAGTRMLGKIVVQTEHARLIDRGPTNEEVSVRDYEPSVAAADIGWLADGSSVMWNRTTTALESRRDNVQTRLPVHLTSEPMNATFADDLVLVALRDAAGRKLVAYSLKTGDVVWEYPRGEALAARCASDLRPPCFVARRTVDQDERYDILSFDPRTGVASGVPLYHGKLEDLAVSPDGQRVLVAEGNGPIEERDLAGNVLRTFEGMSTTVRSVAYDPQGGVLATGAVADIGYGVLTYDGDKSRLLSRSDSELLSLVRPSPISRQVLVLGRVLTAELWQFDLPP
jgi:WD40 repeat protein